MSFAEGFSVKGNDFHSRLTVDSEDGTDFIDKWDTGELAMLASSVLRSDRNWVSVTRSVKPFGEQIRPNDWYTPRNCALQYTKLLSEIEEDSKKKTLPRTERVTSEVMLVKSLSEKRLSELAWLNQQTKVHANILKTHLEIIENGELDDQLDDLIIQIDELEKKEVENYHEYLTRRENLNAAKKLNNRRVVKGVRTPLKAEVKKKFTDLADDLAQQAILDTVKKIKTETEMDDDYKLPIKTEMDSPTLNALLDNKVTLPASVAPTSPLLTSLLRNITSSAVSANPSAVTSTMKEPDSAEEPSKEVSPRSRPTPASSPLLNSLLKNTPSTPITPGKETLSQPFFSPTSSHLSTSNLPQFLQQQQQESPERKSLSPATSACLAAPTLSKLLEMPPSTPGRLPPLPVLDASSSLAAPESMPKPIRTTLDTPTKKDDYALSLKTPEKKVFDILHSPSPFRLSSTHAENIALIEEVSESLEQAFPDIKPETVEEQIQELSGEIVLGASLEGGKKESEEDDLLSLLEPSITADDVRDLNASHAHLTVDPDLKASDVLDAEKSPTGRKFYKSRVPARRIEDEFPEKPAAAPDISTPLLLSPKRPVRIKTEAVSPAHSTDSPILDPAKKQALESLLENQDFKVEVLSPPGKKPRLSEKAELSEEEMMPLVARRSGRKGKKGRGRPPKMAQKQEEESRDQYEFSDTTDDNLPGSFSNTLCYMPRSKDDDTKDSEDSNLVAGTSCEKKTSQVKNKQGKIVNLQILASRKALFTSDEERSSDWLASDDASSHVLSEDKLKKWEETCEKKAEQSKIAGKTMKLPDSAKKKPLTGKKVIADKPGQDKKECKLSGIDSEELSACSRDSDDAPSAWSKEASGDKSTAMDVEVETSSSVAAESDLEKGTDGERTPLSPHAPPLPHTGGKQDWMQGGSPKSSEFVLQSSEDSECESDNWDNQSVSTNKSATVHSPRPRTRKEKETPEYKQWKKAISIVLREATAHKYANVFSQKVTNEMAPGYSSIVNRPMDLSQMKRNVDSGQVRTTEEFQRDMLLMFQNAIMYNNSDHDVFHMAVQMQRDVCRQIQAFIDTQSPPVQEPTEPTSTLRGGRKSQKGKSSAASTPKVKEEATGGKKTPKVESSANEDLH